MKRLVDNLFDQKLLVPGTIKPRMRRPIGWDADAISEDVEEDEEWLGTAMFK
jgi:hypothetical protein